MSSRPAVLPPIDRPARRACVSPPVAGERRAGVRMRRAGRRLAWLWAHGHGRRIQRAADAVCPRCAVSVARAGGRIAPAVVLAHLGRYVAVACVTPSRYAMQETVRDNARDVR